jgi:guanine deaminase
MAQKPKIFLGAFVHCKTQTELEIVENGAIGVDESGVIKFVERDVKSLDEVKGTADGSWSDAEVVTVKKGNWIFPGFIGRCI